MPILPATMTRISLLKLAHDAVESALEDGCIAIDATVGNGHDTLFLAQSVGENGRVYGFDVQARAIENTRDRLVKAGLWSRVTLFHSSHADMRGVLPSPLQGMVSTVMFNLGYLPGGDKSTITQGESTVMALSQACDLLKVGGILTVIAYPGHAGGDTELLALHEGLAKLDGTLFDCRTVLASHPTTASPQLFVIQKRC